MQALFLIFVALFVNGVWSLPKGNPKILNGIEAIRNSVPYQVYMLVSKPTDVWSCSGVLLSPTTLLTTAHCIYGATEAYVIFGAHNPHIGEDTQFRLDATRFKTHPDFVPSSLQNDIGLVKFDVIETTSAIQIAPLPSLEDVGKTYEGEIGKFSGWGLSDFENTTCVLLYTENPIISNAECSGVFGPIEDYQLCLSDQNGQVPCYYDGGGPLVVNDTVIGLLSFGKKNCPLGYPTVFTKIADFLDWIDLYT